MCREVPWIEPEVPEAAVPGEGKELMLDPDEEEETATLRILGLGCKHRLSTNAAGLDARWKTVKHSDYIEYTEVQ